jgi:hypothetical protein
MTYPSEWFASTDPAVESGEAVYKIDGVEYRMRLDSFNDYLKVSRMLDATFRQGKSFAADAVRGHIELALDDADRAHSLRYEP